MCKELSWIISEKKKIKNVKVNLFNKFLKIFFFIK